jgi:cytochrome c biogenesis protein CcmG, thiol:disulfide interchange protein DsbE
VTAPGLDEGPLDDLGAGPGAVGDGGQAGPGPVGAGRPRRTVLWAALVAGAVVAAVVAVAATAQPSGDVVSATPLLGHQAPAVSARGLDGGHFSLGQFSHEWVLVNFMASWCTACQQEMPQLRQFYRQHEAKGDATILTVEYDQADAGRLRSFLARQRAAWPAVNDAAATVPYGVEGLPSSFLVAPGGTVYAYILGQVHAAQLDRYITRGAQKGLGGA